MASENWRLKMMKKSKKELIGLLELIMDGPGEIGKRKGEGNHNAKLKDRYIPDIFEMYYQDGMTQKAIGKEFDVDPKQICMVVTGRAWRHVSLELLKQYNINLWNQMKLKT